MLRNKVMLAGGVVASTSALSVEGLDQQCEKLASFPETSTKPIHNISFPYAYATKTLIGARSAIEQNLDQLLALKGQAKDHSDERASLKKLENKYWKEIQMIDVGLVAIKKNNDLLAELYFKKLYLAADEQFALRQAATLAARRCHREVNLQEDLVEYETYKKFISSQQPSPSPSPEPIAPDPIFNGGVPPIGTPGPL